jgi:hypothetical protein
VYGWPSSDLDATAGTAPMPVNARRDPLEHRVRLPRRGGHGNLTILAGRGRPIEVEKGRARGVVTDRGRLGAELVIVGLRVAPRCPAGSG